MAIDPEFDPFWERMTAAERLYVDMAGAFALQVERVQTWHAQHHETRIPDDLLTLVLYKDYNSTKAELSFGDDFECISLRQAQVMSAGDGTMPGACFAISITPYKDKEGYLDDESKRFMEQVMQVEADEETIEQGYTVFAFPESPPRIVPDRIMLWGAQALSKTGQNADAATVIAFLIRQGYKPMDLNDTDCTVLLNAIMLTAVDEDGTLAVQTGE